MQCAAQCVEWQEYLKTINPDRASNIDLRFYMTRGLVDEVIYAAGGMEREVIALKEILALAQQFCDFHNIIPPKDSLTTPSLGLNAAYHASYSLVNAFSWARTVQERVERHKDGKAYGLLPSLKDSDLKTHITTDFRKLKRRLRSSVYAANYVLHAGALHGASSTPTFQLKPDGTAYLQFPDAMNKQITTWNEHTYDAKRDALVELQKQFDAVAKFIDQTLDAFDKYSG